MENVIDITGVDLVELAKAAYDLSVPQGLGFLHFQEGSLTDDEARSLINEDRPSNPLSMDYVKGRACKMRVSCKDGKTYIPSKWFDHSEEQLQELLERLNVK